MTIEQSTQLADLDGLIWQDNGQCVLTGKALELYLGLDALFTEWTASCAAETWKLPTFISARELARLDYFHSFPHLVTMPVTLACGDANLKLFTDGQPITQDGVLQLTELSPVKDVLTPATCYHFYIAHQGKSLAAPKYLTACANCFRRETHYLPLQRQWNFNMREIVCIGSSDEVTRFLDSWKVRLQQFFADAKLDVLFENATDPFFNPSRNPKYLMQKLDPVKYEMVFRNHLAIGSINFHRSYFGEAFAIMRDGEDACSGCVAFGMERWMYALLATFGLSIPEFPKLKDEAQI